MRTKDQRTRGLGTQGPGTQSSSSVAFSFYDRNASCVNVLSSNIWLYHCGLQSLHCCTHSRRSSHQIAISHYLLAFFIYSLLCKPKNSLFYSIACKNTSVFALRSKGQRSNANRLKTLSLCVQTDSRLH